MNNIRANTEVVKNVLDWVVDELELGGFCLHVFIGSGTLNAMRDVINNMNVVGVSYFVKVYIVML